MVSVLTPIQVSVGPTSNPQTHKTHENIVMILNVLLHEHKTSLTLHQFSLSLCSSVNYSDSPKYLMNEFTPSRINKYYNG